MSLQESRIHIRVLKPSDWKKLLPMDIYPFNICGLASEEFGDIEGLDYVLEKHWGVTEDKLFRFVEALHKRLGKSAIIIADTTNNDLNPKNYCVYYLGDKLKSGYYFKSPEKGEEYDDDIYYEKSDNMFYNTKIKDIEDWINYGAFRINSKELYNIRKFFKGFMYSFPLEKKTYPENLEKNDTVSA